MGFHFDWLHRLTPHLFCYHLPNSTLRLYGPSRMLTRTRELATPILRQRYSQYPGNPDSGTGNPVTDEVKISLLPVPLGLVPQDYPDGRLFKERMMQALWYLKDSTEQHVLAQIWAPVKKGDRYVLTTSGQPFVLDPHSNNLLQYRTVSLMYVFSVDGENNEELGLPGCVFRQKLPEWTPDVQFTVAKSIQDLLML
ncbi:hypothetical protein NE237_008584 [Protea cynaroides]|uniref:Uncharacterized protein n=1 Tax=Protea cynaroides TaxID=273540 RepID=A0A9Q0QZU1_9MAGN|nr:hypothetical protein NE237_008584 [Protea cynaroides]